jgi:hypothetical protein
MYAIVCGGIRGYLGPGTAIAEELAVRNNECLLLISDKVIYGIMLKNMTNLNTSYCPLDPWAKILEKF